MVGQVGTNTQNVRYVPRDIPLKNDTMSTRFDPLGVGVVEVVTDT